jgi:hypothetical protein
VSHVDISHYVSKTTLATHTHTHRIIEMCSRMWSDSYIGVAADKMATDDGDGSAMGKKHVRCQNGSS